MPTHSRCSSLQVWIRLDEVSSFSHQSLINTTPPPAAYFYVGDPKSEIRNTECWIPLIGHTTVLRSNTVHSKYTTHKPSEAKKSRQTRDSKSRALSSSSPDHPTTGGPQKWEPFRFLPPPNHQPPRTTSLTPHKIHQPRPVTKKRIKRGEWKTIPAHSKDSTKPSWLRGSVRLPRLPRQGVQRSPRTPTPACASTSCVTPLQIPLDPLLRIVVTSMVRYLT